MNCEVSLILEHKYEQLQQMSDDPMNQVSQVFEKSLQYVKRFSRYKNPDAVRQVREILSRYQLAELELCVLGNLCPETVEEAIAMVPSIKVYAPISSGTSNIEDRTILVFGCIIPNCGNTPLSWLALRVQKVDSERESSVSTEEVVPSTPPVSVSKAYWLDDDSDEDIDLEALSKALSEAGTMASHSKKKDGNQRSESAVKNSTLVARTGVDMETPVVPCFYMYTQEPSSKDIVSSVRSNYSELSIKEKQKCDYNGDEMGDAGEQEVYEYDKALSADRTYLKFKKQLDAYPDQCFRHLYGGKPLLATAELGDPDNCKLCGGFRHFEMQLMPQLISFLLDGADDCQKIVLENWNWMTLVVYTCPKSCSNKLDRGKSTNSGWIVAEEVVLVQFEKTLQESIHPGYFS